MGTDGHGGKGAMRGEGDGRTYEIIGAAMEVHRILGPWYLEAVYQEALGIEFDLRGVAYVEQPRLTIAYKGQRLASYYVPDFLVSEIVVEIKAQRTLTTVDMGQALNSMTCAHSAVGLLINFGEGRLTWKRLVS
jgi:GxxExxY protein